MHITPQTQELLNSAMRLSNESQEVVLKKALEWYLEHYKAAKKDNAKSTAWLQEAKEMEKNPQKYKIYGDIDEMFGEILR